MSKIPDKFPWYDSPWLYKYQETRHLVGIHRPDRLDEFVKGFEILKTNKDFITTKPDKPVLNAQQLKDSRQIIKSLTKTQQSTNEMRRMGRLTTHDHPYFTELQHQLLDLVSGIAGEALEPAYNFLSLYNDLGVCEVHMDAPQAKWTLDICIDQSTPWPIQFSQVKPWPDIGQYTEEDWQKQIKNDPNNKFSSFTLTPGEGLVFSGSSQWHYRDKINNSHGKNYCHLVFFHYIPKGSRHLMNPNAWPETFPFLA